MKRNSINTSVKWIGYRLGKQKCASDRRAYDCVDMQEAQDIADKVF